MIFILARPRRKMTIVLRPSNWMALGLVLPSLLVLVASTARAQDMSFELDASGEAVSADDETEEAAPESEADFLAADLRTAS